MKFITVFSLLLTLSAHASTFDCFSHEEIGPVYTMSIGAPKTMMNPEGYKYTFRPVILKEHGKKILSADAVGKASSKSLSLTLLTQGDNAIGSISMKAYMPGRLTGSVKIATREGLVTDMSCVSE